MPATDTMLARVVVGRQGIYDRHGSVLGYELRFAELGENQYATGTGLTSSVVFGALNIGLDRLVGNKWIFCVADRDTLVDDTAISLLPARSVIEVPWQLGVDPDVLAGCRRLVARGFTIAIDDFDASEGDSRLLDLASIAKVDVQKHSLAGLAVLQNQCRRHFRRVVGKNVETPEQMTQNFELGFDMLQGYALERPSAQFGRVVSSGDVARARLAATVLDSEMDWNEIEDILRTEPGMTYQVMQLASIGAIGETRRKVSSLRDALVLAGTWRIQNWVALLLAQPSNPAADGGVMAALARARAVELLAQSHDERDAKIGFAAGMLSCFEQLLGIPAEDLQRTLPLSDELREAAFGGTTVLGRIVRDVDEYITGTQFPRMLSGLTMRQLESAMAGGYQWAAHVTSDLD